MAILELFGGGFVEQNLGLRLRYFGLTQTVAGNPWISFLHLALRLRFRAV